MKPLPAPGRPVLDFGVYHRAGVHVRCMEENFFDTAWSGKRDPDVVDSYVRGHLHVMRPACTTRSSESTSNLWFDPLARTWTGRFHRGSFDGPVTLLPAAARPSHDAGLCMEPGFQANPDVKPPWKQ